MEEQIEENLRFWRDHRDDPMMAGMFGLHANLTLSRETLERIARVRPRELPVHVHVGEAPEDLEFALAEGFGGPLDRLDRFGLVDENAFVIHGIHLSDTDIAIARRKEPVIVTNPQSNANNGVGTFDPQRFGRYLLGTDGMTADMVATLRYHFLSLQQRRLAVDRLGEVFFGYRREIQRRFFPDTGALTPGAAADIAVIDYTPVTPITRDTALFHLIYGARTARAYLTVAAGRPLYHDGRFLTVDEPALRGEIAAAAHRLHGRFYG